MVQRQYQLLELFIKQQLEDIHVLSYYCNEASLRLQIFNSIVKSDNAVLKKQLIECQFIQLLAKNLLNHLQIDIASTKTELEFLQFRYFLPFKNESLGMLTSLIFHCIHSSHNDTNSQLFNEFLVCVGQYQLVQKMKTHL